MNIDTNKLAKHVAWMLEDFNGGDREAVRDLLAVIKQQREALESVKQFAIANVNLVNNGFDSPPEPATQFDYELDCLGAMCADTLAASAPLAKLLGEVK